MLPLSTIIGLIYVTNLNINGDYIITFKKRTFMVKIIQLHFGYR